MKHLSVGRPEKSEYAFYYETYISLVEGNDVIANLEAQILETSALLEGVSEIAGTFRYAEGKWSVKELIGHIIDTERVMAYRALRIARNDQTPIEGFEQEPYIENSNFDARNMNSLIEEFAALRRSNIIMFSNFAETAWTRMGTASENPVSARALAYIIAGHELHHIKILRERYLN